MGARRLGKKARRAMLHLVLVAGSLLFSIPFIWLLSTSAKVPDEIFPPRWIPQIPEGVVTSPYVALRENEYGTRPPQVASEDWDRLEGPIKEALSRKIRSLAGELPDFYRPYLEEEALTEGVFSRLLRRAPDELFGKVEDVATAWFVQHVDAPLVGSVFEQVYRQLALSDITLQGWDVLQVETLPARECRPWQVVEGDVELMDRLDGLVRPAQEVRYSFEKDKDFALQAVLPVEMKPEDLKRITVSYHSDRSWHEIWGTLEMGGKRYEAADAGYLGVDKWQDITWQFASHLDDGVEMKTWRRLEEAGPSDFNEPGQMRLTLRFEYAPRPAAAFNKYSFNYREVLRMVPLMLYVRNSVVLVVLTILGQVVASSLVAYAFARLTWPGRDLWFVLVLATLMIPPQVTMIPVFLIFKQLGWYNTLKPLWVTSFFGSAFYIFLLRQFMMGIPKDLEDSAKIDGCGYLGIYGRIILPLVKPALATIAIFTFMATWNDFMGPLIYLSDQELYPLSLGLFSLQVVNVANYGLMMAAAVIMTLPVIVLFFAAQRQFIQGITLTGLKG